MKEEENIKERNSVQVVERALQILLLVAEQKQPITVSRLAQISQLNRSTVWRIIGTMEEKGFVFKDPISKGYALGFAALKLCASMPNYLSPLLLLARPIMQTLSQESQESVCLSTYKYSGIYTLEQIDSLHSIRLKDYTNSVIPLYCSSNGKVALAHFSKHELDLFLSQPLEAKTLNTITDPDALRAEISQVAKQGYGIVCEELADNENGISAPIYQNSDLIGILNISGPAFRFTKQVMLDIAPRLMELCAQISSQTKNITI